jgi:tyrosine-protein kinase Etk/Wzc
LFKRELIVCIGNICRSPTAEHLLREAILKARPDSDIQVSSAGLNARTVGNVRLIDTVDVDLAKPVKPKKALIVLLATLLGAFLSIAFVLVRKALNRGLQSPEAIEQLGLPVYASIPYSSLQKAEEDKNDHGRRRANRAAPLLTMSHPTDLAVEALRSLRTSLHFAMMASNNNRLMISGPSPQVGRTFVSAKYKPNKA